MEWEGREERIGGLLQKDRGGKGRERGKEGERDGRKKEGRAEACPTNKKIVPPPRLNLTLTLTRNSVALLACGAPDGRTAILHAAIGRRGVAVNALLTAPSRAMNGALSQTSVARPTAARRLSASKLKSDERQRAVSILREWACHRHRLRRSGVPID